MTHPSNRRPGGTPPPSVPLSGSRTVKPAKSSGGGNSGGTTGSWLSGCFLIVAIPIALFALLLGWGAS